jgi:hypothetical protein
MRCRTRVSTYQSISIVGPQADISSGVCLVRNGYHSRTNQLWDAMNAVCDFIVTACMTLSVIDYAQLTLDWPSHKDIVGSTKLPDEN